MSTDDKYLERFVVRPSIKLFGGIRVTGKTKFIVKNEKGTVKQTLKNLVLRTEITEERKDIYKTTEHSIMTQELVEGTVLIWGEETCYIIPNYVMATVDEAIESLEQIRGCITNDTSRDEEKDTKADRGNKQH